MRRGSARAVRRPRTGGVCRASARKRRGLQTAKPAWPTEAVCAWMERSGRKACAAGPQMVYKKPPSFVEKLSSPVSRFFVFSKCSIPENAKMRYCSKATIAVFGKLGFSGSRKKRIARFAKRCVFVVSHSARLRIFPSPVSQLKRNSPHSPSQSA